MTPGLLGVVSLVVIGLLLWLPLRWAFAVFVAALVLVPDTMRLPFGGSQLLLLRVFPLVFLCGLFLRIARGEVRASAFRPTPVAVGVIGFGVVAWVTGVMGADSGVSPTFSRDAWLVIPDQLVVLVGSVVACRSIGSLRAARTLASVAVVAAGIAVLERLTGSGYAQLAFRHLPDQRAAGGGARLEVRSGEVRPRVASRFSLAFAWQATMLLPLVAAAAATSQRLWRTVAVPVVVTAIVLTSTRSAYAGMAVGLAVFAVLSGRRTVLVTTLTLAVVGGLVLASSGALDAAFDAPEARGSNAIREERTPVVLAAVTDDPYTGLGYGALLARGLAGTDSSWLQLYAELGAIGIAALALSIVVALATIAPAFVDEARGSPERTVAAAAWTGVALALLGAAYFDLFTGRQSVLVLWVLAAIGATASEEIRPRQPSLSRQLRSRVALPILGLVLGGAMLQLAPRPASITADLEMIPVATDAAAAGPGDFIGRTLSHTTCGLLTEAARERGADASCVLPYGRGPGAARLRVTSGSEATTRAATRAALDAAAAQVHSARVLGLEVEPRSLPTPVRTAPLAGAALGLTLALLLPESARSRSGDHRAAASTEPVVAP